MRLIQPISGNRFQFQGPKDQSNTIHTIHSITYTITPLHSPNPSPPTPPVRFPNHTPPLHPTPPMRPRKPSHNHLIPTPPPPPLNPHPRLPDPPRRIRIPPSRVPEAGDLTLLEIRALVVGCLDGTGGCAGLRGARGGGEDRSNATYIVDDILALLSLQEHSTSSFILRWGCSAVDDRVLVLDC